MLNDILLYIQNALLIPIIIFGLVALEAIYSYCFFKLEDVSYNKHLKQRAIATTLILLFLVFLCMLICIYL